MFNISSKGIMNFTASNLTFARVYYINVTVKDRGIESPHENISLCGQDGSSITSFKQFSLTVTNQNRLPNITSYYPINFNLSGSGSDEFYFNVTTYDPDGTIPDVYWYVDNNLTFYDSGFLKSKFYYTFGCGISGNHIVRVRITDGELNDSKQWNISVQRVDCLIIPPDGGGGGG